MPGDAGTELRSSLRRLGLSNAAIAAAWPAWWSDEASVSPSAQAELKFSVARRLGLDPQSLFPDPDEPRFLWGEDARFKHLSSESQVERAGITSFGHAVASLLVAATQVPPTILYNASAFDLRQQVLQSGKPYVELFDLLSLAWAVGVPVIQLRVFPWRQKRMAAMTVRLGGAHVVLLGKDSKYPAPVAFYLAHELGHIVLNHLAPGRLIVDLEELRPRIAVDDEEERSADEFALELLTGDPRLTVLPAVAVQSTARELARVALSSAAALRIEPGVLAQCFGYSTGDWPTATGALRYIYQPGPPVWSVVNLVARNELALGELPSDAAEFLDTVLGVNSPSSG